MTATATAIKKVERPDYLAEAIRPLEKLDTDQLLKEYEQEKATTLKHVVRLAAIVLLLEERECDLSGVSIPGLDYVRKVAYGQLRPEVYARYAAHPRALRKIAALPIPDQRRMANDEPLKVVVIRPSGPTHRMVPVNKMTNEQLNQTIAAGHIRDEVEQIGYLDDQANHVRARAKQGVSPIVVSKKKRGVFVTGEKVFISVPGMLDLIRQASS